VPHSAVEIGEGGWIKVSCREPIFHQPKDRGEGPPLDVDGMASIVIASSPDQAAYLLGYVGADGVGHMLVPSGHIRA
jgi:hypothetical protein